jgi:hypothetical protein
MYLFVILGALRGPLKGRPLTLRSTPLYNGMEFYANNHFQPTIKIKRTKLSSFTKYPDLNLNQLGLFKTEAFLALFRL